MTDHERTLARLAEVLSQVARPHGVEDDLPPEIRSSLWQLGFPCTELTSREELIARLWARKRILMAAMQPQWGGGPGAPTAA
jgi:hypothetical protein